MKEQSLRQMAMQIVGREIDRWRAEFSDTHPQHRFDTTNLKLKLTPWIEAVSNISEETIAAALAASTKIEVEGRLYLPSDLHIIKQQHSITMAASFVDSHDKRQSHHIPVEKLWTPSLFPKLDYEDARRRWLILGETQRVLVGTATNVDWRLLDNIKAANFKAQEEAYDVVVDAQKRREALFRKNPDCTTTDALLKKLGAWK